MLKQVFNFFEPPHNIAAAAAAARGTACTACDDQASASPAAGTALSAGSDKADDTSAEGVDAAEPLVDLNKLP